jgi:hypothetical protein
MAISTRLSTSWISTSFPTLGCFKTAFGSCSTSTPFSFIWSQAESGSWYRVSWIAALSVDGPVRRL